MNTLRSFWLFAALAAPSASFAQDDGRLQTLEEQLRAAQARVAELETTLVTLAADVTALRTETLAPEQRLAPAVPARDEAEYAERILVTDLGDDERDVELTGRPELFVQSRYHANPIDEATEDDVTRNLSVSRMELRWAGRVSDKIGMGYELQYHPAPDGAAEELINDAYVEYYTSDAVTVRIGQFVKPFGFDIQHSSSMRESPERGLFAGYFFPGQRDRGIMLAANLDRVASGLSLYAGIFNGNRFFNDNNGDLNYNLRLRKVFDAVPLAIGASLQRGTQLLPPGVSGSAAEDLYGVDVQYVIGRLGIRGEYVRGDMPSTLLALEPEFAPAFVPGEMSSGTTAFFNYNVTTKDDIYWRWDRFENDPVTGADIRAFNFGYTRWIGESSRIGIDYQSKNDVTYNDDELNTRFSLTWNLFY